MTDRHYSEYGQDQWLEENVFKGKRNGVFFEAGALDGLLHSNTLFFERHRDWTGVLVEANPDFATHLRLNRPIARCSCYALWDNGWDLLPFKQIRTGLTGWSGVLETTDPQHVDRIQQHVTAEEQNTIVVPAIKIATILEAAAIRYLDYLSLDIEGAELKALQGFDFEKVSVDVLGVENNYETPEIAQFLATKGYKQFHRQGVDDFYRRF